MRRLVELCQGIGSDGAGRTSNKDYVSPRRNTASGFLGREAPGIFIHKIFHLSRYIVQLPRNASRCEIVDELPESADGRVLVNEICRDPSGVQFRGVPQRIQNGVANPSRLQTDYRYVSVRGSESGVREPDLSQLCWKISSLSFT